MFISGVENSHIYNDCQGVNTKKDSKQEPFEMPENEVGGEEAEQAQEQFMTMSFKEIMYGGKYTLNSIPQVNQIVISESPQDGKRYYTAFTDRSMTCYRYGGTGDAVWSMDLDAGQSEKVKQFFAKQRPDRESVKEIYSAGHLNMTALKSFWLDLFEKDDK